MSIFARREKLSLGTRIMRFLWPRMSWRRIPKYWTLRLKRLQGTPYAIACGFACGAAVSFTPFIGLHFVLAALLAWVLRGHILASAIGTAVGNPWTFPAIWAAVIWLGTTILGYEPGEELPAELTISVIFSQPLEILLPMLVGGVPIGVVVWVIFFFPIRRVVANYQNHRRLRRLRRKQVLAEERNSRQSDDRAEPGASDEDISIPDPRGVDADEPEMASNVTRLDKVMIDRSG